MKTIILKGGLGDGRIHTVEDWTEEFNFWENEPANRSEYIQTDQTEDGKIVFKLKR